MNTLLPIFKALSDRNRLRIVAALSSHQELCACQITELLEVAGATTSRHLSVLVNAGLVESRKEGRWVHYQLATPNADFLPLREWIQQRFESSEDVLLDLKKLRTINACDPEELCRKQRGKTCCPEKKP